MQGPLGRTLAIVVSATAPATFGAANEASDGRSGIRAGDTGAKGHDDLRGTAAQGSETPTPSGASGLGQAIAAATGLLPLRSTDLVLPVTVLTAIAWMLASLLLRRRATTL
jgi:hypothetical protein